MRYPDQSSIDDFELQVLACMILFCKVHQLRETTSRQYLSKTAQQKPRQVKLILVETNRFKVSNLVSTSVSSKTLNLLSFQHSQLFFVIQRFFSGFLEKKTFNGLLKCYQAFQRPHKILLLHVSLPLIDLVRILYVKSCLFNP